VLWLDFAFFFYPSSDFPLSEYVCCLLKDGIFLSGFLVVHGAD
jgi:hypothetical protein